jgi:hypothetical protein
MTAPPNRPLPVQLQVEHPEWVRELAFVCWLACDRNASRAVTLLEERWPEDEPRRPVPYRTLATWAQRGNWDAKADEEIAKVFPGLTMRHTARLVHLAGLALTTLEEVISGDGFARDADGNLLFGPNGEAVVTDPRHRRNRLDGAIKALELAGVGTAGSRHRAAPVVRSAMPEAIDFSAMSLQELGRYQRELMKRSKTDMPERKR